MPHPIAIGFNRTHTVCGWCTGAVIGIAIGFFYGGTIWFLLTATVLWIFAFAFSSAKYRSALLFFCMLTLCAAHAGVYHEQNLKTKKVLENSHGKYVEFDASIGNDLQIISRKRTKPYARFTAEDSVLSDGTKIHGTTIAVRFYSPDGIFPNAGERWKLHGKISHRKIPNRIEVSVREAAAECLIPSNKIRNLDSFFRNIRRKLADKLAIGIEPENAVLIQTMTLGTGQRIPPKLRDVFANCGIIHIFAISGIHVGIVGGVLIWLFHFFPISYRQQAFFVIPLLVFYLFLVGLPPSAVRACMMASIYFLSALCLSAPSAAVAFFLTLAGVMIVSPNWISNIGALLSFSVMGGIILLMQPFQYLLNDLFRSQKVTQENISWHLLVRRGIATYLALTFSAWISSIPFSLFFFGQFSLIGLALNTFIPLIATFIIWAACFGLLFGTFCTSLMILFNKFCAAMISLIQVISVEANSFSYATFATVNPPNSFIILSATLCLIIWGFHLRGIVELRKKNAEEKTNRHENFEW